MTYILNNTVDLDEYRLDAFGRLRVSTPSKIFDCTNVYNDFYGKFQSIIAGTGTATFNSVDSTIKLQVGTTSGDRILRETNRYMHYEPGNAFQVMCSGVLPQAKNNVVGRIGYYDDNDGFYFASTGTGPVLVERYSTSTGSMLETTIPQAQWNVDPLDGNGPSKLVLDVTKIQIFLFDFQWLGAGRVRAFIEINGKAILVHQFNHANIINYIYLKSCDLPIRYELINTGTSSSITTMKQGCSAVIVDGNSSPVGTIASVSTTATKTLTSTLKPIISIQMGSTVNGVKNRGYFQLLDVSQLNTANTSYALVKVLLNPTLTGANFIPVDSTRSVMNYDISATAVSGGNVLYSTFIDLRSASSLQSIFSNVENSFFAKPTGTNDIICVAAQLISGTPTYMAALSWKEIR